ncbi:MAG TPA: phytoene/squalene synthase family protein [Armatimonadota bacterium]|jgi:phytoene synthase
MTSPRSPQLQASYRYCCETTRAQARNFYYGFMALPKEKRESLCAIYAFMRYCDDLVDDEQGDTPKHVLLESWRATLDRAAAGDVASSPILPAFADAVRKHEVPLTYFHELITGAEMDLQATRYATFQDLYRYCYHVASVVGLVCIHVFGFRDPEARRLAEWQGIAFQLTNILRDLAEDAGMGRVYLPQEDLARFGYHEEDLVGRVRDERFRELMTFEVDRAEQFYAKSAPLVGLVDRDSRACLRAMVGIYHGLLERIRRSEYDVYSHRAKLPAAAKLGILARSLMPW